MPETPIPSLHSSADRQPRLVVVTSIHPARDARIFYRQACFAARGGYEVVLLGHCEKAETVEGVRLVPLERKQGILARLLFAWKIAWLAWKERGDIYHFHDPDLLMPMTVLRLLSRRPVIYDCHEHYIDSIHRRRRIPRAIRHILAGAISASLWIFGRLLGRVIIVTEEQGRMFPASVHPLIIKNFAPRWIYPEPPPDEARPIDLVHCGTISVDRGSRVLLEMLRILVQDMGLKNLRMLQLGSVDPAEGPAFRQALKEMGLEENIEKHKFLPLTEVPHQLARAKIGLIFLQQTAQYRYGVSSKMFDYMAAGLAIVGGNSGLDHKYAPEDTVRIYVDQTDPAAYAQAVYDLLQNAERRQAMGAAARQHYLDNYTAEEGAGRLLEFYQESLGRAA